MHDQKKVWEALLKTNNSCKSDALFGRFVLRAFLRVLAIPLCLFFPFLTGGGNAASDVDSSIEKIVQSGPGDTIAKIAVREFGTIGLSRLLAEYNEISPDATLLEGTEIIIPTHLEPKQNFATVIYVKGGATLHIAGSRHTVRMLEKNDRIYTTDLVITDETGFVSTRLSNGSVLNVQPESRVSLQSLQCLPQDAACQVQVDATEGSVAADVKKRVDQKNRFLISTPYASAAVRGTVFDFGADDSQMRVGVTHGEVEISAGPATASLPIGYGVLTDAGARPGDLITLLKAPGFSAAPARFAEEDVIGWNAVPGASGYQVSISSDSNGEQEIYRESVDSLLHPVRPLSPGEAYAIVRPVDKNQLKGFRARQALNIVAFDRGLPKPALAFENEDDAVYVFAQDASPDSVIEVQFSLTEDFKELVSVDIPGNGGAKQLWDDATRYFARARLLDGDAAAGEVVGSYGNVLEIAESD